MAEETCSQCGGEMDCIEKTTFTGRDLREYQCRKCGKKEIVDGGQALWEILSESRDADEKK